MRNPYHWNRANPHLFYGTERTAMLEGILSGLSRGESFALVGGRRLGKTTFLKKLHAEIVQRYPIIYPFYVDAQAIPYLNAPEAVFDYIAIAGGAHNSSDKGMTTFCNWIKDKRKNGYIKIAILIDEFDVFREYPWAHTFFNNWRSLIHNTPSISENLVVVFAGTRMMQTIDESPGSPLGNVLGLKHLFLLSEEDTIRLINEPNENFFPDEVAKVVWIKTGGHPFLIQFLMYHLCDANLETNFIGIIRQAEVKLWDDHEIIFKHWWFDHLKEEERQVYRFLQLNGSSTLEQITHQLGTNRGATWRMLRVLGYTGLVRKVSNLYTIGGTICDEWIRENDIVEPTNERGITVTSPELELQTLIGTLEKTLRKFVHDVLGEEGEIKRLHKIFPDQVQKANQAYQRQTGSSQQCPEAVLLEYTDFAFPFEIVLKYWGLFFDRLRKPYRDRIFGSDRNKAKLRFEERKDVLTKVRNELMHSRTLAEDEKDKARVYCRELLSCIVE
jgi:hypothetical protein